MEVKRLISTCLLLLSLGACVNLEAVRDFAGESAKLSGYTELTIRFRDTYKREQPYLSAEADLMARENDKRRQTAYQDLLKVHEGVSLYMRTLATLAGDDTFDVAQEFSAVSSGIKAYPDLGIDAKHVDAFSNMSKVLAKWATSAAQERAVREMVKEGGPHLQVMLEGMVRLVRYYRKTFENEEREIFGLFETELPFANGPKDRLLVVIARAHVQAKAAEYQAMKAMYAAAEQGIKSIADGHKRLLENVDRLSSDEAKHLISRFAKDIKAARSSLKAIPT